MFSEGVRYVGVCPEFRISGMGDTQADAMGRLQGAVEAYLQECKDRNILDIVLEESGFKEFGGVWKLSDRSAEIQVAVISSGQMDL